MIDQTVRRLGLAAVAVSAALAAPAMGGEHPGALWKVEVLSVEAAPGADEAGLREALRQANEVYFYGDHPARMRAVLAADGTVEVTVTDMLSGAVLLRRGGLSADGGIEELLAWMDLLDCADAACSGAVEVARAPAAPETEPVLAARAAPANAVDHALANMPVPMPRPAPVRLRAVIARNPEPDWGTYHVARLARLGPGVDQDLSYGDADRFTHRDERLLRALPGRLPPSGYRDQETLLDRIFSDLASLFGPRQTSAEPEALALISPQAPAPVTVDRGRQPSVALAERAAERRAEQAIAAPEPFRPSARWRLARVSDEVDRPGSAEAPAPRLALLDAGFRLTALDAPPSTVEALAAPSAPAAGDAVATLTPDRVVVVLPDGAAPAPTATPSLTVKLHSDVFSNPAASLLRRLFERPPTPAEAIALPDRGDPLAVALAAKGLVLDSATYATVERIYWEGSSESRGFWISLPRHIESGLVLVATGAASVVADVRNRAGPIRVSDEVAEAMNLAPGAWTELKIVALRRLAGSQEAIAANE